MGNHIPDKVYRYNVYDDKEKLVGLTGEVTLPNLESMSETISGPGILGEIDSPNLGQFGSTTVELSFRMLYEKSFSLMKNSGKPLVLRAAQQSYDSSSGAIAYRPLKITIKYLPKGLELGKLAEGAATETKNTLEVIYIKIEENGIRLLELDKLNAIYVLDGEDMLKNINSMI